MSIIAESSTSTASNMAATNCMWPLNTWSVASATEELDVNFLFKFNFHLNLRTTTWCNYWNHLACESTFWTINFNLNTDEFLLLKMWCPNWGISVIYHIGFQNLSKHTKNRKYLINNSYINVMLKLKYFVYLIWFKLISRVFFYLFVMWLQENFKLFIWLALYFFWAVLG